jgi:hypothetical protein
MKIIKYDESDNGNLILACEKGVISIFKALKKTIAYTFDINDHSKDN